VAAEIDLDPACVVAVVSERVAAGMSQHMDMGLDAQDA
jgi:hypothetical protein